MKTRFAGSAGSCGVTCFGLTPQVNLAYSNHLQNFAGSAGSLSPMRIENEIRTKCAELNPTGLHRETDPADPADPAKDIPMQKCFDFQTDFPYLGIESSRKSAALVFRAHLQAARGPFPDRTPLLKMQFARKVQVYGCGVDAQYIFSVHPEEAQRMIAADQAVQRGSGKIIRAIALTQSLRQERRGPCTPVTLRQFAGQTYTYREPLESLTICPCCLGKPIRRKCDDPKVQAAQKCFLCGGAGKVPAVTAHTTSFKKISEAQWPIFVASKLDCLPPAIAERIRKMPPPSALALRRAALRASRN